MSPFKNVIRAALLLAVSCANAGCVALPPSLDQAPGQVAARIEILARAAPVNALPEYSLGRTYRTVIDPYNCAARLSEELRAAQYAPSVDVRIQDPLLPQVPPVDASREVWSVALEFGPVEYDEQPGAWYWVNTALWITTWIPSAAVPDRVFEGRAQFRCKVYRGADLIADRPILARAAVSLSPVQYGQSWLGLIRFEFAPGGGLHRAALDAGDWREVAGRLDPYLAADLARRVAGLLDETFRAQLADAAETPQ